jgi:hypothetical protein
MLMFFNLGQVVKKQGSFFRGLSLVFLPLS